MTFAEFLREYPTEKSAIDYYVETRYGGNPVCNHCGSPRIYQMKERMKVFHCNNCKNTFSPFTGTIFAKSSTDLRKWMFALHSFLYGRRGLSPAQLRRETGVTYKTAWWMIQQIRLVMDSAAQQSFGDDY